MSERVDCIYYSVRLCYGSGKPRCARMRITRDDVWFNMRRFPYYIIPDTFFNHIRSSGFFSPVRNKVRRDGSIFNPTTIFFFFLYIVPVKQNYFCVVEKKKKFKRLRTE